MLNDVEMTVMYLFKCCGNNGVMLRTLLAPIISVITCIKLNSYQKNELTRLKI